MHWANQVLLPIIIYTTEIVSAIRYIYSLQDDYNAANFFTEFKFFSDSDPTHGFVTYENATTANDNGLAKILDGNIYLGVDHITINPQSGRASTRVESLKTYDGGLFIADILHMPGGICGVWPALWTVGANWPTQGEIDIIEGVNLATTNSITLHTTSECTVSSLNTITTSSLKNNNCNSQNAYEGCSTTMSDTKGYGTSFNDNQGGVYVMEWTLSVIQIWFFPRDLIPDDINHSQPDPTLWGPPTAQFTDSSCDFESHFKNHYIVFNTALCGDWPNNVWKSSACAAKTVTCQDYVASNPKEFEQSYWLIKSLKVYQASQLNLNSARKFRA